MRHLRFVWLCVVLTLALLSTPRYVGFVSAQLPINVAGFKQAGGGGGGGPAARSVILDGVDDGFTANTGASLPSSQGDWRFMAKLRGLSGTSSDAWLFHEFSGERLQIKYVAGGSYGIIQVIAAGPGFTGGTTFLVVPGPDVTLLVRCSATLGQTSLQIWTADGATRVEDLNTGFAGGATDWQFRDIGIGRQALSAANYFPGKIDKAVLLTGAGTYGTTMPDVEATTGNLLQYDFNDNGNDSSGNGVNLTMSGTPAYENTP